MYWSRNNWAAMTSTDTRVSALPAIAEVAAADAEMPSPLGLVRLLDSRSDGGSASAGGEKGLPGGGPGAPSLGLRSVSTVSLGRRSASSSESLRLNGFTDAIFALKRFFFFLKLAKLITPAAS